MDKAVYKNIAVGYFNRSPEVLDLLPNPLARALEAHWNGDLSQAIALYEECLSSYQIGSDGIRDLLMADFILLKVKRGDPIEHWESLDSFSSYDAKTVLLYAQFYWAFWIDHSVAFQCLKKIIKTSLRSNAKSFAITGLFLYFHLLTIEGKWRVHFWIASYLYRIVKTDMLGPTRTAKMVRNVVIASYPYTQFVAGAVSVNSIESTITFAEQNIVDDPFYHSLVLISGFYGYAYSGNVSRTEIFAERFRRLQKMGKLRRYKPLTEIMWILPYTLRGYGYFVEDDFLKVLGSFNPDAHEPLINSQFYRAGAVISLILGRKKMSQELIQKAQVERGKTNSFKAWASIDQRIWEFARSSRLFEPGRDKIANLEIDFTQPPGLSGILVELLSIIPNCLDLNHDQISERIATILTKHLDSNSSEFKPLDEIDSTHNPQIIIGDRILEILDMDPARVEYAEDMISALKPMVTLTMKVFNDLRRSRETIEMNRRLESDREKNVALVTQSRQVAHDIKSPLSALKLSLNSARGSGDETMNLIKMATKRIEDIVSELDQKSSIKGERTQTFLLPTIHEIVSEKRLTIPNSITMSVELGKCPLNLHVGIDPQSAKRVFSNILNNAVEALDQARSNAVKISVENRAGDTFIRIRDSGRGIPEHCLNAIFVQGQSFGKEGGQGLGLSHAKRTIEAVGGIIWIEDTSPNGTTIAIKLPSAPPPSHFLQDTPDLTEGSLFVIDHEASTTKMWDHKRKQWTLLADGHLDSSYGLNRLEPSSLDVPKILLTNDFESREIAAECSKLGIKILPKPILNLLGLNHSKPPYADQIHHFTN